MPISDALDDLRAGKLVVVGDDEDRECEGDLIGAASLITPQTINFMLRHARGAFIAVFMPHGLSERLSIGPMYDANESFHQTQFRIAVDATDCRSGSSAAERARTVQLLGSKASRPEHFVRPGHVVPIAAHPAGLSGRRGHTEAGVALMQLAGIDPPVAVDLEILDSEGEMARRPELIDFASRFGLKFITVDEIARAAVQSCMHR
jgi:3,4-dihydroxy 2-butanone 4-phosphate synthase / GTP cyclohydrolase II